MTYDEARVLMRSFGERLSEELFHIAFLKLVEFDERVHGSEWISRNPDATVNPEDRRSSWEGCILDPDANLVGGRKTIIRGVTIFVCEDYIEGLLS